ncbi:MAG TPA: nucleotidyltransferase [Micromonosporaceae bacterium]|nr:nucleotidyltransferase [Micromonosporaceae bacterium]
MPIPEDNQPLIASLKLAAYHLKESGIPFCLAGSFAVYARGGESVDHDVDFLIKEADADAALSALAEVGFRTEVPPEGWLVKVYDEDRLIDLIYSPVQRPVTDETLADTDVIAVNACHMPVLSATQLMIHKMLTWSAHHCDFARGLPLARSLREQIDWAIVARETAHSPFAQAFLVLLDRLGVVPLTDLARPADTQADAAAADADAGPRRGRLQEVAAR